MYFTNVGMSFACVEMAQTSEKTCFSNAELDVAIVETCFTNVEMCFTSVAMQFTIVEMYFTSDEMCFTSVEMCCWSKIEKVCKC